MFSILKTLHSRFTVFILWSFILLSKTGFASFEGISIKEMASIKAIATEAQRRCPPEDCFIVGIGRSPTPIIAYLQAIGSKHTLQVPLSKFRYSSEGFDSLSHELEEKLFHHFDQYLSTVVEHRRKVLIVDFSPAGRFSSLLAGKFYIQKYLSQRGPAQEVHELGITRTSALEMTSAISEPIVLNSEDPLSQSLANQEFDSISAYGPYNIQNADQKSPSQESQTYQDFVGMLRHFEDYLIPGTLQIREDKKGQLVQDIESIDPSTQAAAAIALGLYHGPELENSLRKGLQSEQEWTQKNSIKSIIYLGETGPLEEIDHILNEFLSNSDGLRCKVAPRVVHFNGDFLPLFRNLLASEDRYIRALVAQSLKNYEGPLFSTLLELCFDHPTDFVVSAAIRALREYQGNNVFELYEKSLKHLNPNVRSQVAYALAQYQGENVHLLIKLALSDENETVRRNAIIAARALGLISS